METCTPSPSALLKYTHRHITRSFPEAAPDHAITTRTRGVSAKSNQKSNALEGYLQYETCPTDPAIEQYQSTSVNGRR
jgi:hypothetical protein